MMSAPARPFRVWFLSRDGETLATEEDVEDVSLEAIPGKAPLILKARLAHWRDDHGAGRQHDLRWAAFRAEVHLLHPGDRFTRICFELLGSHRVPFDRAGRSTIGGYSDARTVLAWLVFVEREEMVDLPLIYGTRR